MTSHGKRAAIPSSSGNCSVTGPRQQTPQSAPAAPGPSTAARASRCPTVCATSWVTACTASESDAANVLRAAAVIGIEFDLDLVAAVLERPADALLDELEEARRARLVREEQYPPGRYRFKHALVKHSLELELGVTRRARLHERIARL